MNPEYFTSGGAIGGTLGGMVDQVDPVMAVIVVLVLVLIYLWWSGNLDGVFGDAKEEEFGGAPVSSGASHAGQWTSHTPGFGKKQEGQDPRADGFAPASGQPSVFGSSESMVEDPEKLAWEDMTPSGSAPGQAIVFAPGAARGVLGFTGGAKKSDFELIFDEDESV